MVEGERQTYVKHRLPLMLPHAVSLRPILQKRCVRPTGLQFCSIPQLNKGARQDASPDWRATHHRIPRQTAFAFVPWRAGRRQRRQSANDAAIRPAAQTYFFGIFADTRRQFGWLRESDQQKRQNDPCSQHFCIFIPQTTPAGRRRPPRERSGTDWNGADAAGCGGLKDVTATFG